MRHAPVRLVPALVVVLLAACSTGNSESDAAQAAPTIAALATAAENAGPATLSGTAFGESITGGYDPARRLSSLRFPVLIADRPHIVEVRRAANTVFFARDAADAEAIARAGAKRLALRPADQRTWIEMKTTTALRAIGPIDPSAALDSLAARAAKLTDIGSGEDGARRYRVEPQRQEPRTGVLPLSPFAAPVDSREQLTLVIGPDRRIRKWEISTDGKRPTTTIDVRYGSAPVWQPPARDHIFTGTGTGPARPNGAFVALHSGNHAGVAWALERAPGTLGTTCWRVRTMPSSRGAYGAAMDDGSCVLPPTPEDDNVDLYAEFPYFPAAGSPVEIVVLLTPPNTVVRADAQLVGGRTAPAQVFADEGIVLFAGDPGAPVWALTVTDGVGVHECSSYVYDIAADTPTRAADAIARRANVPPACLEHFNQTP